MASGDLILEKIDKFSEKGVGLIIYTNPSFIILGYFLNEDNYIFEAEGRSLLAAIYNAEKEFEKRNEHRK